MKPSYFNLTESDCGCYVGLLKIVYYLSLFIASFSQGSSYVSFVLKGFGQEIL